MAYWTMLVTKASMMNCLMVTCVMGSFLMSADAQSLRKGAVPDQERKLQYGLDPVENLNCHIQLLTGQFEDGSETEVYACALAAGESELGGLMYSIDLSEDFINDNRDCITKGACFVDIPGAQVIEADDVPPTIAFPEGAELSVINKSKSSDSPTQRRQLAVTGTHEILIVRITSKQAACQPSAGALAASILNINPDAYGVTNSMKTQYERCSQGQLSFKPVSGNGVVNGVLDVYMDENTNGVNIFDLINSMYQAASNAVGSSLSASPKHIMYIVPGGTTFNGSSGWVAFAHVNGNNGWWNDKWGMSLSAEMHEIGHNIGMHHSNESNQSYQDQTGLMGYSYNKNNGPLMCFNAFHHYSFGWYESKTIDASNGGWTGTLTCFVDASSVPEYSQSEAVIVKVGDVYFQLNCAKGFNQGTQEKANEIVLIEGTRANVESNLVASLDSKGDKYYFSGSSLVLEVCQMNIGGSVDSARVGVYSSNQSSGCARQDSDSDGGTNANIGISGFQLINTDNNQELAWNSESANNMAIVAETWGDVQSVQIKVSGTRSYVRNENQPPFTLFGDSGWGYYNPGDLPPGKYTVQATAWPQKRQGGLPGKTVIWNLTIPSN